MAEAVKDAATKVGNAGMTALKGAWNVVTSKWTWGFLAALTLTCAMANPLGVTTAFKGVAGATGMGDVAVNTVKVAPTVIKEGFVPAAHAVGTTLKTVTGAMASGATSALEHLPS